MKRLAIVAGVLGVLGTLTTAAPASADRVIHRDARHDVMKVDFSSEKPELVPAPHAPAGDVTRAMIDHRYRRVVLKLRYAELERRGFRFEIALLSTSGGGHFVVFLDTAKELGWQGRASLADLSNLRQGERPCRGLWHEVDYRQNTVKLSVPRRCLDDPRWIRAGIGGNAIVDPSDLYVDDALSNTYGGRLAMTRRLYRN
jgi:hypothetical protein